PARLQSSSTAVGTASVRSGRSSASAHRRRRQSRHRDISCCVAAEGSTPAAAITEVTSTGEAEELGLSLQHLTLPGEEEEEDDEGRSLETAAVDAAAAVPATPEKQPRPSRPPSPPRQDNTNAMISTVVSDEDNNAPIDWILSRRLPENSRRFYRKALEAGDVKVDGRKVRRFVRVKRGARISVDLGRQKQQQGAQLSSSATGGGGGGDANAVGSAPPTLVFPERLPRLRVVYEDEHLFAVMKPAGMVCQPCQAAPRGTVLHGLMYHMVQSGQIKEGSNMAAAANTLSQGVVQRLDKHTSGIMIVAKTLAASSKLSRLFKKGKVEKEYLAVCFNDPGFDSVVDAPLYRRSSGKVGAVNPWEAAEFKAKEAKTRVRNVATAAGVSLCRANILTGRMHQVRVHLKWIGCPIVGDREYGDPEANMKAARRMANRVEAERPLLHSVSLEFVHPFTNKLMSFKAPMPADMWETAEKILRVSGTREQQEGFGQLQELRQSQADEAAPLGGRGAPRLAGGGRG
ncbi:unnamed protein product, partial [Hapterophycus canaliculatus]